ncbi:DUF2586 family protein [Aequorivita sp. H23M31]|uniref:DUF2586 family protein n=1 Tax=Aequorivita ciconiae TaxID=2494375 RepID=A0A410G2D5_9FLAO|nr:DUF2586 family protein [Aequorivita sp. H23M31]QAA81409.1 DUF2586 family protein [Aequorivita sp. H23M31]
MAQLSGVNIEKLQGGLERQALGTDNHVAMVFSGMKTTTLHADVNNAGLGVKIRSVYDAEQLGFNESFDANESVNYYDQIVEFFRLAPEATLYLFSTDVVADITGFLNANKDIKGYATDFIGVETTNELEATDLGDHQAIIDALAVANRLIDFAVIGVSNVMPTIDLFTQECPIVSVATACEKNDGKASIGSVLGMIAVRKVSENLGSVDIERKPLNSRGGNDYPLTNGSLGRWIGSYLPDGTSVSAMAKSQLNAIIEKGYIVAASYEGYPGFFFENSYTAIEQTSDYAFIENNRVWNKASRIIRETLLPKVKSKVKKDPTTGFIASTTVSYWKTLLEKSLNRMLTEDDISGFEVSIDHKQVVNSTQPVKVKALIVADGIVHEFTVAVGLTNNI